jgi:hypothetical protein
MVIQAESFYLHPLSTQIRSTGGMGYNAQVKTNKALRPYPTFSYEYSFSTDNGIKTLVSKDEVCVAIVRSEINAYVYYENYSNTLYLIHLNGNSKLLEKVKLVAAELDKDGLIDANLNKALGSINAYGESLNVKFYIHWLTELFGRHKKTGEGVLHHAKLFSP